MSYLIPLCAINIFLLFQLLQDTNSVSLKSTKENQKLLEKFNKSPNKLLNVLYHIQV